ncbi:MAG TPA: NAD(P)H-dependent glycerol-3-phosphate dehydrogenase [Feifaniaceae bacterium]|nr:NAD(P)H-dependent glycerol-3-phosphate dehydrogenase [Feifaniaceae bacterium]
MRIGVIGCGRWGSFIAWYLDKIGHTVSLYGRSGSSRMEQFLLDRTNGLVTLEKSVRLTTSLSEAAEAETLVVSIGAQGLRALMEELKGLRLTNKTFVLCMKGIEIGSGKRLTEVVAEYMDPTCRAAVWLGPGHVQEFVGGTPNCMVIDSGEEAVTKVLVEAFSSELIRFYYGRDLIGNEIGAAAKNVIGIAAGILDGLGLSTLKGALTSRGTREIGRLIAAMGGSELSAYGLCHLGDYGATVFSPYSHNRRYGEAFVTGEPFEGLAEGVYTVRALMTLSERYGVELPICAAVHAALYEGVDVKYALERLFTRSLKPEF